MTAIRVSAEDGGGRLHDLIVDAGDNATVADLTSALSALGYGHISVGGSVGASIGGQGSDPADEPLDHSGLRHGTILSAGGNRWPPTSGWYLVAIAGPDTGAWIEVTTRPSQVGRSSADVLRVNDRSMSSGHFTVAVADGAVGEVIVEDCDSTNGTAVEGTRITGPCRLANGGYLHAGSSTFAVFHLDGADIPAPVWSPGPTQPFQRRFRSALEELPRSLSHPNPPRERSEASRRPLIAFAVPIISAVGMALVTGRYIFLLIIALGPIVYAVDGYRRRKIQDREDADEQHRYAADVEALRAQVLTVRSEDVRRDRWSAAPAGLAALLVEAGHQRLWERRPIDDDFCEVAIGLHDRRSGIGIEGAPADGPPMPLDHYWAAVLRHSLVADGSLAIQGPLERARAIGRSLVLDLASSQSPHDLKVWLLTDGDTSAAWNGVRWLPHNYMGGHHDGGRSRVFASPRARAAALQMLRAVVNERRRADRDGLVLPVHLVVVDCLRSIAAADITDLLIQGAGVGVFGVVMDEAIVPEGTEALLTMGGFADEARFESGAQHPLNGIRSSEMSATAFERATRAMADKTPAGSGREPVAETGEVRLVDLIDAVTDRSEVYRAIERWGPVGEPVGRRCVTRAKIGALGEMETSIDLMRDGPHGLIAGTTRAGKTEFLKSLVTSFAVANHPDDLSFVIVDFKGGVDHRLTAMLPHVVALSTNQEVSSFVRTLKLIDAEQRRRQALFDSVGANNYDVYQAARADNDRLPPLPRLVVMIDEFSELLASEEGQENLPILESVTRVGGGLGVHLLLATQNFEHQLPPQIAANAGLRICFRVQDPSHSKAVLGLPDAADIPAERIGRAIVRCHGGRPVEFQGARIAGARPGRGTPGAAVKVRAAAFSSLSEAPSLDGPTDVVAEDTDLYAVAEVLTEAATRTGWTRSAVPWPGEVDPALTVADVVDAAPDDMAWPIGVADEPHRQRQPPFGLPAYGPSTLLLGGNGARLDQVVRSIAVAAALRRGPHQAQAYVIDLLGQGLGSLRALPHVGGAAERNEPLAMRIVRHLAAEVAARKSRMAALGVSDVSELVEPWRHGFGDLVLYVHGGDRLILAGESDTSPLMAPVLGLLSESVGTGVRLVVSGPPQIAHHRLGSSVGDRLVFRCSDRHEYGALDVSKEFVSALGSPGRAVHVASQRLVQVGLLPVRDGVTSSEVVRAVGQRLDERWSGLETEQRPTPIFDLPWPIPIDAVRAARPTVGVEHPVLFAIDADSNQLVWLDAEEDGPIFTVAGGPGSGRSSALMTAATLMADLGWQVFSMPLSRRSPMASDRFVGKRLALEDLPTLSELEGPVALFVDDANKCPEDAFDPMAFCRPAGVVSPRAVFLSGPPDFFSMRSSVARYPKRTALLLAPRRSQDANAFGFSGRLGDDVLRDQRPGTGVLLVAGQLQQVRVPNP